MHASGKGESFGMRMLRLTAMICFLAAPVMAQTTEERTAAYLESIRHQPSLLLAFLQQMPKGGDLHVHLSGAIYAESMIDWASENALCVDRATSKLIRSACDTCETYRYKPSVRCAYQDHVLYNQLIDAWSMRNWHREEESGHDHFFGTFEKFDPAFDQHHGNAIAEIAARAAADHLQYVEIMHTADGMQSAALGAKAEWDDDFARLRNQLLTAGLADVVAHTRAQLDQDEARKKEILHCGGSKAEPGCDVTIHYLYQVLRGLPREQVFAQIVLGFELVKNDQRFVGFNLVMPEDWYTPMHDFDLHMRMIEALRKFYSGAHISLHAGELAMGLVPPEDLRFHIRESIERAGAERIGHGTTVMYEDNPLGLLREMEKKHVAVEICLTSADTILGTSGDRHPLPIYMKFGVPVALATDDQGVSRSDMTHEYLRAVETYGLKYGDLKRMARTSLEHSFIPGASLWSDRKNFHRATACDTDASGKPTPACQNFLDASERARVQWRSEQAFAEFEKQF
jgi:adenosine deaminase